MVTVKHSIYLSLVILTSVLFPATVQAGAVATALKIAVEGEAPEAIQVVQLVKYDAVIERIMSSKIPFETVIQNAELKTPALRVAAFEKEIQKIAPGFKLDSRGQKALMKAHDYIGNGQGLDSSLPPQVFNYSAAQVKEKMRILMNEGGLSQDQASTAIRYGFAGGCKADDCRMLAASYQTFLARRSARLQRENQISRISVDPAAAQEALETQEAVSQIRDVQQQLDQLKIQVRSTAHSTLSEAKPLDVSGLVPAAPPNTAAAAAFAH